MILLPLRRIPAPLLILTVGALSIFQAGAVPPVNSVAPTTTGTPVAGKTLSGTNGTWTNTPTSYTYQWQKNGANIAGATTPDYVIPYTAIPTDTFRRLVTAGNSTGTGATPTTGNTLAVLPYDADATAWFTRIEALNPTATPFDLTTTGNTTFATSYTKAVWNEFFADLKTAGVWDNIKDLTAFFGVRTIQQARRKIKQWAPDQPNRSYQAQADGSSTETTAGFNYTFIGANAGIKPTANGVWIDPSYRLSDIGITTTNGHMFVLHSNDDITSNGRVISDVPIDATDITNVPTFSMANSKSRFVNSVAGNHDSTAYSPNGKGFFGAVFSAAGLQHHAYGIFRSFPSPGNNEAGVNKNEFTPNTLNTARPLSLLRAFDESSGTYRYANNRLSLVSLGATLTEAQSWSYYQILDKLVKTFGIFPSVPDMVFLGDSGSHGYGLENAGERYTRLVADHYGAREINHGILTARFMTPFRTYVPPGKDGLPGALRFKPERVNSAYGSNDFNDYRNLPELERNTRQATFMTEYGNYVQGLIDGGITPANISVTGLAWSTDIGTSTVRIDAAKGWNNQLLNLATSKGAVFVDFYSPTLEGGLDEMVDGRHGNKAGMITRSKAIITSVAYPNYARWAAGQYEFIPDPADSTKTVKNYRPLNILNPRDVNPGTFLANPTRDADGDGIPDIGEYLMDKNPWLADPISPVVSGTNLTLTYPVNTTRTEVTETVEASPDLTQGSWITITSSNVAGGSGNIQMRRASIPLAGPNRFLRLRFTR